MIKESLAFLTFDSLLLLSFCIVDVLIIFVKSTKYHFVYAFVHLLKFLLILIWLLVLDVNQLLQVDSLT